MSAHTGSSEQEKAPQATPTHPTTYHSATKAEGARHHEPCTAGNEHGVALDKVNGPRLGHRVDGGHEEGGAGQALEVDKEGASQQGGVHEGSMWH